MKIALFGGSFNPMHIGHTKLAEFAIKELKLDKLIFIPAFKSLDKTNDFYEDNKSRCKIIELVLFDKTELSTFEIDLNYPVPSYETIKYFSNIYKKESLFFLIGEDNLSGIESWEGIEEINELITVAVFKRFKETLNVELKILKKIIFLKNPLFDFSSKSFRNNKNYSLLDKKVAKYIQKHDLYK